MSFFLFELEKHNVKYSDIKLSESELLLQRQIVKRLIKHEPIQQIIGVTEFYGLKIFCTKNTLIPRPETEELVDLILNENTDSKKSILDIGTGTGCIPISIIKNRPTWAGTGIDISYDAIEVAKKNSELHNINIELKQFDILNDKSNHKKKYDIIVSNPPYVLESDKLNMDENVLVFEPHLALFVPDTAPLLFYKKIVEFSLINLIKDGLLYFEIHENFGEEVKQLLINNSFEQVKIINDLQGKNRIVKGVKK